jgi:hypothetical protein
MAVFFSVRWSIAHERLGKAWLPTFLILNLLLHIIDCVRWLDVKGDRLARKGLDENL